MFVEKMAGILVFGKEEAITDPECAPDFMVDYSKISSDISYLGMPAEFGHIPWMHHVGDHRSSTRDVSLLYIA